MAMAQQYYHAMICTIYMIIITMQDCCDPGCQTKRAFLSDRMGLQGKTPSHLPSPKKQHVPHQSSEYKGQKLRSGRDLLYTTQMKCPTIDLQHISKLLISSHFKSGRSTHINCLAFSVQQIKWEEQFSSRSLQRLVV